MKKSVNNTTYIKTKSPEELGLDIDTKGLYVMTETKWIKAMVADYLTTGNALLQFGVGETTSGTIRDRMGSLSSSKNLLEQKVLIDSEPNPDYSDHDLHPLIRQSFAYQVSSNPAKREVFECNIQDYLVEEFIKSNDFVPIAEYVTKQVRKQQGKLNKDHVRKPLHLRDIQKRVHDKIIKAMRRNGININIIAELAPRLGKTLLFLELAKTAWKTPELGHQAMFVLAYGVGLSIKASYKEEISKFSNFAEFVFIDNAEDDAQEEYDNAIANGKFPVVFVSLNAKIKKDDDEKEERLDWIGTRTEKAIALLEETDFGVHTDSQIEKTQKMFANMEVTQINSSGTNIGRIAKASGDKDVDAIIRVPYCMVEQMRNAEKLGIVKRKFYNMTFNPAMNKLLEGFDKDVLPNITKILADANTQEKFISALYRDILGYEPVYGLNINRQADEIINHLMLFTTITKTQMRNLAKVIETACPEHKVLILNGDESGMSNKEAQNKTFEELVKLENGKYPGRDKLIVMTNMMGTRSYSVPEIQACLFMMEGGGIYAFMQRYSRCLTPGVNKKFGHIFDFSFDQNKTRNTEMAIAIEAAAVMEQKDISFPDAVREVMFSVSLKDKLIGEWTSNDAIDRFEKDANVYVQVADALTRLGIEDFADSDFEHLVELAKRAMSSKQKSDFDKIIKTGKTYENKKRKGEDTTPEEDKAYAKALKDAALIIKRAIKALNEGASTVAEFTNYEGKTYEQCLDIIANSDKLSIEFNEMFGTPVQFVIKSKNKLSLATLDMIVEKTNRGVSEYNVSNSALGIVADSPKLWREALSTRAIRRKITSKKCKSILVVAGGLGTEIDVLVELYGIDILDKIVYNEKYTSFCNRIKRKYPHLTILQGDFLELEFNMSKKFDVIVGNPPFQDPDKPRHKLWTKFLKKSVGMAKYVVMVAPKLATQMLNGFEVDHTKFDNKVYVHTISLEGVKDHFNEGSDFCWFVISESEKNETMQVIGAEQEDWKPGTFIPYKPDAMMASIISKTMNFKNDYRRRVSRVEHLSDKSDSNPGIEKFLADGIVWKKISSDYNHRHQNHLKMLYPTLGQDYYLDKVGNVMPTTSFVAYLLADNVKDLNDLPKVEDTEIFQFLRSCFMSRRSSRDYVWMNIKKLNTLDMSSHYDENKLTIAEREYIKVALNVK